MLDLTPLLLEPDLQFADLVTPDVVSRYRLPKSTPKIEYAVLLNAIALREVPPFNVCCGRTPPKECWSVAPRLLAIEGIGSATRLQASDPQALQVSRARRSPSARFGQLTFIADQEPA